MNIQTKRDLKNAHQSQTPNVICLFIGVKWNNGQEYLPGRGFSNALSLAARLSRKTDNEWNNFWLKFSRKTKKTRWEQILRISICTAGNVQALSLRVRRCLVIIRLGKKANELKITNFSWNQSAQCHDLSLKVVDEYAKRNQRRMIFINPLHWFIPVMGYINAMRWLCQ